MIKVGIIGMGFMGGVHLRNWQSIDGAKVVAVCDANPVARTAKQGNLDVTSETLDLEDVAIYSDVGEMFVTEKLDTVSIALPTYLHREISIRALGNGIHVLCEKPMALNVADCDLMIAAAAKAGKHLMVAQCIRFWPEYAWVKKVVESGEYGKVLAADFQRLSAPPAGGGGSWFADTSKSGGVALDLHIHDLDYIQYLFGIPRQVCATVSRFDNGVPGHVLTILDYGDDRAISATGSWMMPPSFGFKMGFDIIFEKALVVFDSRSETTLKVYPSAGESFVPEFEKGDGYKGEIEYFFNLVSGTNMETVITPEQARESVRLALETMHA
ncbi:MAG: Gfo/Idh/MocA family oxidoreductase [Kiritimatiellales bacterium]|nr:Gfo/Idh/MocA family oxidoreductase [Kiritimatiellales bacterium]